MKDRGKIRLGLSASVDWGARQEHLASPSAVLPVSRYGPRP
jgi:hypothetical protein